MQSSQRPGRVPGNWSEVVTGPVPYALLTLALWASPPTLLIFPGVTPILLIFPGVTPQQVLHTHLFVSRSKETGPRLGACSVLQGDERD